jgi:hypothetical protein
MLIKLSTQDWFKVILTTFTVLLVSLYAYMYIVAKSQYGDQYIPLLITARTLILAFFLLYFYNPLRSEFEYGRSLPFFAFSAGISLLLLLDKFQILNLVHFVLYGELLPENPHKVCKFVEGAKKIE